MNINSDTHAKINSVVEHNPLGSDMSLYDDPLSRCMRHINTGDVGIGVCNGITVRFSPLSPSTGLLQKPTDIPVEEMEEVIPNPHFDFYTVGKSEPSIIASINGVKRSEMSHVLLFMCEIPDTVDQWDVSSSIILTNGGKTTLYPISGLSFENDSMSIRYRDGSVVNLHIESEDHKESMDGQRIFMVSNAGFNLSTLTKVSIKTYGIVSGGDKLDRIDFTRDYETA